MTNPHSKKLQNELIEKDALTIINRLQEADYVTYLVGGCVRDLLLGIVPKDFDIATMALPSEIKRKLPQSYIIGKRFRLVLAKRMNTLYEIATFRKNSPTEDSAEITSETHENPNELAEISSGKVIGDNFFGSPKEDAFRRDFTVNSLFYDPFAGELHDFCGGLKDLDERVIRMIGDPYVRLKEDPIRIMRGLRLAHKIDFDLDPQLRKSMMEMAHTLAEAALPRKREELIKWYHLVDPSLVFLEAYDLGILQFITPTLNKLLDKRKGFDDFIQYLKTLNEPHFDHDENLFYYSMIVSAFIRSFFPELIEQDNIRTKEILENTDILSFMKEELGMFNYEQDLVARALNMQSILKKRVQLQLKGDLSIESVYRNEAFPLALFLAKRDFCLDPGDWNFWFESYNKAMPQLLSMNRRPKKKSQYKKKK